MALYQVSTRSPNERSFWFFSVLFLAVLSVWSWLSIRHVQLPENPASIFGIVSIFFYALFIFATATVLYRSRFWGDRAVFGIVAGVAVLIAIKTTVPLAPSSMLVVNVAKSSMLTIAALVSLSILARGSSTPFRNKPVTRSDEPREVD
jgi:hypothetical protein